MSAYSFSDIECKWQERWEQDKVFFCDTNTSKKRFYCLAMYPYPSGVLHMGHVINYTLSDMMVRYKMMRGYHVLSPMGWDSFGLPAENAAMRSGIPPKEFTEKNIETMREQIKKAGWGFDWSREIATSHPDYYRWTQWLFLQFYKSKLAYKKKAPVNWCPECVTVLANEQVIDGACERCHTDVEQKDLHQWFYKMSAYAQKLLDGLDELSGKWPDKVIKMQKEWIGRSEGARVDFPIEGRNEVIRVFTTRPDTLYGVTFVSLALEHPLVMDLIKGSPDERTLCERIETMRSVGTSQKELVDVDKEGVALGVCVINPLNGERVPLWAANYALMSYGTGAVMAVPAHDQRDFEFAKKYQLPIRVVIQPKDEVLSSETMTEAYEGDGYQVNSAVFDGLPNREAMPSIIKHLEDKQCGEGTINYRLRDWLLSRQRYWGAPIPIVYCPKCGEVPVLEEDLPVCLPDDVTFQKGGGNPLERCDDFVKTSCPSCGTSARRETDTMDTFVDSSWYFLRYVSPRNTSAPFDKEQVHRWCPVDLYIGGIEHATMHLIYVRFFTKVLHDLGLISITEPAENLFCQGMVCKTAYYSSEEKWLAEDQVDKVIEEGQTVFRSKKTGQPVHADVAKMSKTKLNTVNPDAILKQFGADTLRLYMLSDSPPDRDQIWSEEGLMGSHRFLNRFWKLCDEWMPKVQTAAIYAGHGDDLDVVSRNLWRKIHQTIEKVTSDVEGNYQFNTAISKVMELLKELREAKQARLSIVREAIEVMIRLIAPITPHVSEELWSRLGHDHSIFQAHWPDVNQQAMREKEVQIILQVNGKLKNRRNAAVDMDRTAMEQLVLTDDKIKAAIKGMSVVKVITVQNKLVNVVVR